MRSRGNNDASSWDHKSPLSLLDFYDLAEAREIIVFGSRAVGVHRSSSDLDILVVSSCKRRIRIPGVDCVLLTSEEIDDPFWLGSELASHVVQFGNWIKGDGEWRNRVCISDRAIARKQHRVGCVVRNATQRWPRLHPVFHMEYATTTRRELQRLDLLMNGSPIPPTAILDSKCKDGQVSPVDLLELAEVSGCLSTLKSVPEFKMLITDPVSSLHPASRFAARLPLFLH